MKGFRFARFVEEYTKRSIHLNFKMLTLPQLPHQQDPEQRQSVPGVDQPFISGAEQVGRPGHAQVFGAAFDAVELFNGEAAGGGEALHGGVGVGAAAVLVNVRIAPHNPSITTHPNPELIKMSDIKPKDSLPSISGQDEEYTLHRKMEAFRARVVSNKQASIEFLQRAGILTPAGKLARLC